MKKQNLILIIFLLNFSYLYAQVSIKGKVSDSKTDNPIIEALVFINGTTMSALTDNDGNFKITGKILFPAEVIVNFLGYTPTTKTIYNSTEFLNFKIDLKAFTLSEVKVSGNRENLLKEFKKSFFGKDKWAKKAIIKNDEVIFFQYKSEDTIIKEPFKDKAINKGGIIDAFNTSRNDQIAKDSVEVKTQVNHLSAFSEEPIKVELSELGYELQINLIYFYTYFYNETRATKFKGFFFFKPLEGISEKNLIKIKKNRELVYYNSPQHFIKSLYYNKLSENGYGIYEENKNNNTYTEVYIPQYLRSHIENKKEIRGLQGKEFIILYYHDKEGKPIDITKGAKPILYNESHVKFSSNSIKILPTGTSPDLDKFIFSGDISEKLVATMLPDDYEIGLVNKEDSKRK